MEKKHYDFLDYIRVLATCFVVFMHAAAGGLRTNPGTPGGSWHLLNIATSLAFCAVPLFFMISGFLLLSSERTEDISHLLKKRLPRLIVPLIVYSLPCAVWVNRGTDISHVSAMLKSFLSIGSTPVMIHFWFMYTLIAVYLVSPFLRAAVCRMSEKLKTYLFWLIVAAMVLSTLFQILPPSVSVYLPLRPVSDALFFNNYICALFLGWLLGQTERRIPNKILIAIALIDWAFIAFMTYRLTVANDAYITTYQTQNQGFELLLAVCLFLLFKQNLNRPLGKVHRWITPMAALSFPVYLVHNLIISILCAFGFPAATAPQVLALMLTTLVIAYLLTKTLATIKPLCFLCVGLPYAQACRTCNWVYTFRNLKNTSTE